jgi:hypothetical protein
MSVWQQIGGVLKGILPQENDGINSLFGYRVCLSSDGNTLACSSPNRLFPTKGVLGGVSIFKYDPNKLQEVTDQNSIDYGPVGWRILGKMIIGETYDAETTEFGEQISLSNDGTVVAISSIKYNNYRGHVRVYRYDANKLVEITDQNNPNYGPIGWTRIGSDFDSNVNQNFGGSISLSGDGTTIAITASEYDIEDPYVGNCGSVFIYKYDPLKDTSSTDINSSEFGPIGWRLLGKNIIGKYAGEESGYSVSLNYNGKIVAIGSTGYSNNKGRVNVYSYDSSKNFEVTDESMSNFGPVGWKRLGKDIIGNNNNDRFGETVSISSDGTTVAIGAKNANSNIGYSAVYKYDANKLVEITDQNNPNYGPIGWNRLGQNISGKNTGDFFGTSISLSFNGSIVAISSQKIFSQDNGYVEVYRYDKDKLFVDICENSVNYGPINWKRIGQTIIGDNSNYTFGCSISLNNSGNYLAIANKNANNTGETTVYKLIDNTIPISNICFPKGTPINTDQGIINIDKIDKSYHTINNLKINHITKTISPDNYLICIEQNSLGKNIPSKRTIISKNHKIQYKDAMLSSKQLLNIINNKNLIYKIDYEKTPLYNILFDTHEKIVVNNLICETLDPKNGIAKLYNYIDSIGLCNDENKKIEIIKGYNDYINKNNIFLQK